MEMVASEFHYRLSACLLPIRRFSFLVALAIAVPIAIWLYATLTAPELLPSADGGQWLAYSRYYSGQTWPRYHQPLTVPPLFPSLMAVFASVLGPLTAIPVLATLLFVGFCLSAFMLARELFGDELAALTTIVLAAAGQSLFLYLIAFGGYLQLMALLWMNVAFLFWCRIGNGEGQAWSWWGVTVATLLVLFSHTPTVIVFLPITGMMVLYLSRQDNRWDVQFGLRALKYLALPVSGWVVYLLLFWDQHMGYATNEAGFYRRGLGDVLTLLGDNSAQLFVAVGLASLLVLAYAALRNRNHRLRRAAAFIAIWLLVPFAIMLGTYGLRIGTDYERFGFYFSEPLLLPIAFVFGLLLEKWVNLPGSIRESNFTWRSILRAGLLPLGLVAFAVFFLLAGLHALTFYPEALRYFSITNGDALLDVTAWLDAHAPENTTVVSPFLESRWIEGLDGRATLVDLQPYFLYRPGEIDRALAANLIASGTYSAENGYILVRTQQVPGSVPINPSIAAYSKGMYVDVFTLQDRLITLDVMAGGVGRRLNLDRDFQHRQAQLLQDETGARLISVYDTNQAGANVAVSKTISVSEDSPEVTIDLNFTALGNTDIHGIDFRIADPIETSGEKAIARADVAWVDSQLGQTAIYRKDFDGRLIATDVDFTPFPSRWMATQGDIRTGEPYFAAVYSFEGRHQVSIHLTIKPQTASRSRPGLATGSVFDLVKSYNVTHILAKQTDKPLQAICKWYGYRQVYSNSDYVVYQVPGN